MSENIFTLPGGYIYEGDVYSEVELKQITGREEELIAEMEGEGEASVTTALLTSCIKRLGLLSPVSKDMARNMLVGDRDFLLMKLCQITFGDKVEATLACPACSINMDVDFSLNQIEVKRKNQDSQTFTMELSPLAAYEDEEGNKHRNVEFRLPKGGDLETIEGIRNEADAVTKLLSRCIKRVGDKIMDENIARSLTALARREIEKNMSELAPGVELDLDIVCYECQHSFTVPFNIGIFFLKSLR